MKNIPIEKIKELRERTNAGLSDCRKALLESNMDLSKSVEWLKKQGLSQMAKRAGKEALEGLVASYIHTGGRIGVLVEVNTETDFSARSEAFKKFVKNLTLHIAAMDPLCISKEDIPPAAYSQQKKLFEEEALNQGKSKVLSKILEGKLLKWQKEVCLLDQEFVCPDASEENTQTIKEALAELVTQIREKIQIRRFVRFELGGE